MNNEYQYFTINDYEVIVIYGSIQYKRQGRISYKENLSDGEPVFHNPGNSKVFQVTCDILIPINEDKESSLFNEINKNVTENKSVTINSNFGKLFPSGEYYIDNFEPKWHDKHYYECNLTLTNKGNSSIVTEFYGDTNHKITTENALVTDKESVKNKIKKTAFKTIGKGSNDTATVKKIQKALKRNGFYLKSGGSNLKVDGVYGKYTVQAVQKFQKKNGLKVTGKVDEETAKKLGLK